MDAQKSTSPANESLYFNIQADFGFTKHPGGMKATRDLAEACHINKDSYVLVIGCGVGITPCAIVEEKGCRMVGVDLSTGMVEKSIERAAKKGLEEKLSFRTADAQDLPFEANIFDAVICESVNAFIPDKPKAIHEYLRVVKPGGFVGINEVHWIKEPAPELHMPAHHGWSNFLTVEGWKDDGGSGPGDRCGIKMDMHNKGLRNE
jgi:ubiquinone/menaquinone biosynthesis C-methylase UbiE